MLQSKGSTPLHQSGLILSKWSTTIKFFELYKKCKIKLLDQKIFTLLPAFISSQLKQNVRIQ